MKNKQLKRNKLTLGKLIILLTLSLFLINSCRKDEKTTQQTALTPDVSAAKSWYEGAYPAITGEDKKSTSALHTKGTYLDLSQFIEPDWQHSVSYVKQSKGVIELPIDPGNKINSTLKNIVNNNTYADKANSRSSFIFLKDGNGYKAYIMTIIADASYLKNDISKLANNTYRKHDADFSGLVLYFTPKGKYLNGYRYTNGKLITASATNNTQTTNIKSNKLKVNKAEPVCIDWYWDTYIDDELVSEEYLYTTCIGGDDSGGGGGGGNATPPQPCTSSAGGVPDSKGKQAINKATPQPQPIGDDPGYPPPVDNPDPCIPGGSNTSEPDFGEDDPTQCLNCRITDANFSDYLAYITEQGYQIGDPIGTPLTVNGVNYPGQLTPIYDSNGTFVATYFTPDVTSGPFEAGTEYRVGIGADGSPTASPTTNSDFNFGSIAPEVGPGNTVSYTPPSSGGGGALTYNQRVALETADNNRILNLLKQEDAADDAAANPCTGTGRSGNIRWPGTLEHWMIQFDYVANNPGALREYMIPGSSGKLNGNPGYADIVNELSKEMFEIKPDNPTGEAAGAAEIQIYVTQGNLNCPPTGGGTWKAGTNYPTRYLPDPKNPLNQLEARLGENGVILYISKPNNGNPKTVPVILPENLAEKLKNLLKQIAATPSTMQQQILAFLRANPSVVPYLKGAAAGIIVATILEDIATEGIGIADDWESFVVARTLWRMSNTIALY